MSSTIDKTFHNHYFILTHCNYTIPSYPNEHLNNYLTATPKTTFTSQIIICCYFTLNSLINKLQPLSYQFMSNVTPRLPLHASQPTPKIYNATTLHTSLIHIKKTSLTRSTSTPKYTLPLRLVTTVYAWLILFNGYSYSVHLSFPFTY